MTLRRLDLAAEIYHINEPKIPVVMSLAEAKRLLAIAENLRVHIVQAKGRKDRHVILSPETLDLLRMVQGATDSLQYGRAARAALVVPWPRKADDDPAAQSSVSRDG